MPSTRRSLESSNLPPAPNGWDRPASWPNLEVGELHAWWIDLDQPATGEVLSVEERARADRLRAPGGRERFVAGRRALRGILGGYLGLAAGDVAFCYGGRGKPALAGELGRRLEFNLTHSAGLALLVVVERRAVGVDVEEVRPMAEADRLVERFFSVREREAFRALAVADRLAAFFRCWTRKEAYLKATGEGLGLPLEGFDVSLGPAEPARLLNVEGRPGEAERWSMADLDPGPGFIAALAVEGALGRVRRFCWEPGEAMA